MKETDTPEARAGLTVPVRAGTAFPYWNVTEAAVTASAVVGATVRMIGVCELVVLSCVSDDPGVKTALTV